MRRMTTVFLAATLLASPALATDYLTGYAGIFDATQNDDSSAEFGAEYRYSPVWRELRPLVGAFVNTDGGVYGYGGVQYDFFLTDSRSVVLSPNFTAGAYGEGDSKDLGYWLEFKSGIELAYQFENASRVGVAFNHISNADLGNDNPGTENVILTYSHPMGE